MGYFDPSKYNYSGDFARSIVAAREDLERDYPGARVFINSNNHTIDEVRLAPPDGHDHVVRGRFEVPRTGIFWRNTYGYHYTVFSEGTFRYSGRIDGSDWATWSGHAQASIQESNGVKTFIWRRQDGSSRYRPDIPIDLGNWMSRLSDDLYLSQVTIPGTHNSHAVQGTPIVPHIAPIEWITKSRQAAECQGWSIKDQLQNGARFLDLRYGDDLKMRHGQIELPGNLRECIRVVTDFLDTHPRETVVVIAKWDKWGYGNNEEFVEDEGTRAQVTRLFADSPRFLDTSTVPTLRECRGKFIRKLEGRGNWQGLDFEKFQIPASFQKPAISLPAEPSAFFAGAWFWWRVSTSWLKTKADLDWNLHVGQNLSKEQATTVLASGLNDYHMSVGSVLWGSSIHPFQFSKHKNEELVRWLDKDCSYAKVYRLGFVTLDWADYPDRGVLLKKLVLTNFTE
ncbi:hypothetical protein TWF730_002390 [Orbilia blumenaviensis]|uniref:Phosphatidylinositol-specific phospholipase C X domain-containing protein n=1 Tax=Orbilia blumenaviensis TaxID=1796055 RepID=A0AAV9UBG0_9PEZI